jgi:hypothetical protein
MKPEANAVLLKAKTQSFNDKPKQVCDSHTERKVVALPDAGRDDWTRFKRECVLLTGRRSK